MDTARFWSYVKVGSETECWPWQTARTTATGYGRFSLQGRGVVASRVAFRLFHGRDAAGFVCHTCDNPPCVNPTHLFEGDGAANYADCRAKGRTNNASGDRHGLRVHPERRARGNRNPRTRLREWQVREARDLYLTGGWSQTDLAKRYGVTREVMSLAIRGATWKHVPADFDAINTITRERRSRAARESQAKLTENDVRRIRELAKAGWPWRRIAEQFPVSLSAVQQVVQRRSWKHVQ